MKGSHIKLPIATAEAPPHSPTHTHTAPPYPFFFRDSCTINLRVRFNVCAYEQGLSHFVPGDGSPLMPPFPITSGMHSVIPQTPFMYRPTGPPAVPSFAHTSGLTGIMGAEYPMAIPEPPVDTSEHTMSWTVSIVEQRDVRA